MIEVRVTAADAEGHDIGPYRAVLRDGAVVAHAFHNGAGKGWTIKTPSGELLGNALRLDAIDSMV